jgi:hypothetical protein
MNNKNIKIANINVKLKTFFRNWMQFTQPFHKLPNQQQAVLALLLFYHYQLKSEITNTKILWKAVFDYDIKIKISNELEIQPGALENLLSQLRKRKIIVDNQITPAYVPELDLKAKKFTIVFNFNIKNE